LSSSHRNGKQPHPRKENFGAGGSSPLNTVKMSSFVKKKETNRDMGPSLQGEGGRSCQRKKKKAVATSAVFQRKKNNGKTEFPSQKGGEKMGTCRGSYEEKSPLTKRCTHCEKDRNCRRKGNRKNRRKPPREEKGDPGKMSF